MVIRVLDVNDCRPQFSKPQFSTSVYENEPAGTSVITMLATDQDEGSNGQLTYSLEGPGMGMWPSLAAQEDLEGGEGQAAMSTMLGQREEAREGTGGLSQPGHPLLYLTARGFLCGHGLWPGDHAAATAVLREVQLDRCGYGWWRAPTLGHHNAPGGGHRCQ